MKERDRWEIFPTLSSFLGIFPMILIVKTSYILQNMYFTIIKKLMNDFFDFESNKLSILIDL